MNRRETRVLAWACGVYHLLVLALLGWRAVASMLPPFINLLDTFRHFLFLPLIVTLPLAGWCARRRDDRLARWSWRSGIALAACFVALYGGQFLPRWPAADGEMVRVQTFNVGWGQKRPTEIVGAIERMDADLVAVIEMFSGSRDHLRPALAGRYPHVVLEDGHSNGLLSRWPIWEREWVEVGVARPVLRAVVAAPGGPLVVYVVHLDLPTFVYGLPGLVPTGLMDEERAAWLRRLMQRVDAETVPVIVMGDFNMAETYPAYEVMTGNLRDSYREAGWGLGLTWPQGAGLNGIPVPFRLVRLDYVFHSPDLAALEAQLGTDGSSDHAHLTVTLRLDSN